MYKKLRRWRNIIIVIGSFFLIGFLQRGIEAIIPDNVGWDWFHQHRFYLFGAITIAIVLIVAVMEGIHNKRFGSELITSVLLVPFVFPCVMIAYHVIMIFINFEESRDAGIFDMMMIFLAYFYLIGKLDKLKDAMNSNTGKLVETHEMLNRKLTEIDSSIRGRNFYEGE